MSTPPYSGSQSAEMREAAWLSQSGDSLPSLLTANGGPFELVEAFDPVAARPKMKNTLYVMALHVADQRVSNMRIRPQYEITLDISWPARKPGTPLAETAMQDMKNAVDLVLQRVRGLVGDKTHGGRFLSVAEVPAMASVAYSDPAATIPGGGYVGATVSYRCDDFEING
jgi:hypothetical protein